MIVTCPLCSTKFKYNVARFANMRSKQFQCTACSAIFNVTNPYFTDVEKNAPSSASTDTADTPVKSGIMLAFLSGPKSSTAVELTTPQTIIGRNEGDIMTMDPETSKRHAMIEIFGDGTVWLSDLGSTNGTFTKGYQVTRVQLADRQEFSCGKSAFMLLLNK